MRRARAAAAALLAAGSTLAGCGVGAGRPPSCTAWERLGLLAQSVPSAMYVPCVGDLAPGWSGDQLRVSEHGASFELHSDRAAGRPVTVRLGPGCDAGAATPIPSRTITGRSLLWLRRISPRYTGTLYDVFPGGCVTYSFDFPRVAHIALMAEFEAAVDLVPRGTVRAELRRSMSIELDP